MRLRSTDDPFFRPTLVATWRSRRDWRAQTFNESWYLDGMRENRAVWFVVLGLEVSICW